jgi:hypothetical protein
MKHFGPKFITLEDIKKNYSGLISRVHFIQDKNKIPTDDDLKEISDEKINILMKLGVDGLPFLSFFLRGFSEIDKVTKEDEWDAYCECDGFGKMSSAQLKELDAGWDWSHVRDSSPEAIKRAEDFIKTKLVKIYNES